MRKEKDAAFNTDIETPKDVGINAKGKAIRVDSLCKKFGDKTVLDSFDFEFQAGKITCIMGESGIGKTTLQRILMGLEKKDSGVITGIDEKTRISAVFQEDRLCDNLTAYGNIVMVCDKNITKDTIIKHLTAILPESALFQKSSELSGGMRQRVAIVRAMISSSEVVMMDEPFKGLDEENKLSVIKYIKDTQKGRTMLVVTHNSDDIKSLGAQICLLTKL